MEKTKKAFQNVIAKIRKETGDQFPKAMMTRQQMNKATATVNCGGEFKGTESSKELAEKVLNDERFNEFLKKNEAAALVEAVNIAGKTVYQVRVLFEGYGEDEFAKEVAQQLEDEENDQEYLDAVNDLINEESKAEAPAKKTSRKGPRACYIFYYTDKNGDGNGYEVFGTQGFYDALKFLHSAEVKATRIEIYKKGPNFENDHEDVSRAHTKYWK